MIVYPAYFSRLTAVVGSDMNLIRQEPSYAQGEARGVPEVVDTQFWWAGIHAELRVLFDLWDTNFVWIPCVQRFLCAVNMEEQVKGDL